MPTYTIAPRSTICPYCSRRMVIARSLKNDQLARTKDHIRPKAWGGNNDPNNIRLCCRRCNELRAGAGHCHAIVMMAWSVARGTKRRPEEVLRQWKLYQYQWLPGRKTA